MSVDRETAEALGRAWDEEPVTVWQPPGVPRLAVGDRVRWRRNDECQWHNELDDPRALQALDGGIGTIEEVGVPGRAQMGHGYSVRFDHLIPAFDPYGNPATAWGVWAAGSELIPLNERPLCAADGTERPQERNPGHPAADQVSEGAEADVRALETRWGGW